MVTTLEVHKFMCAYGLVLAEVASERRPGLHQARRKAAGKADDEVLEKQARLAHKSLADIGRWYM